MQARRTSTRKSPARTPLREALDVWEDSDGNQNVVLSWRPGYMLSVGAEPTEMQEIVKRGATDRVWFYADKEPADSSKPVSIFEIEAGRDGASFFTLRKDRFELEYGPKLSAHDAGVFRAMLKRMAAMLKHEPTRKRIANAVRNVREKGDRSYLGEHLSLIG